MYKQPQVNEADWKLFRSRLPKWQEAYMDRLNQEYIALLSGSGSAAEKFWDLDRRMRQDRQSVGVVARMSRSNMDHNIIALLADGVIGLDDLNGFSDDLRERMTFIMRSYPSEKQPEEPERL